MSGFWGDGDAAATIADAADAAAAAVAEAADDADAAADAVAEAADDAAGVVDAAAEAMAEGAEELTAGVETVADRVEAAASDATSSLEAAAADAARAAEGAAGELASGVRAAAADAEARLDRGAEGLAAAIEGAPGAAAEAADALQGAAADAAATLEEAAADARGAVAAAADALAAPPSVSRFQALPLVRAPVEVPESAGGDGAHAVRYLKTRLLAAVAGLDRGSAASSAAAAEVEATAAALVETAAASFAPVDLRWKSGDGETGEASSSSARSPSPLPALPGSSGSSVDDLAGTWRLLYSSAFARAARKGRRGGPAVGPFRLGQVFQAVSPYGGTLDNVVELVAPPPPLPSAVAGFLRGAVARVTGNKASSSSSSSSSSSPAPVVVTATLRHSLELGAGGPTATITFEGVDVRADGGLSGLLGSLPALSLPAGLPAPLRPSASQRTSAFDVLYLDGDLRVARGERGELRVFCKVAA